MYQDLVKKAFIGLYPDREFTHTARISYSAKFHDYNANVKFTRSSLHFNLSSKWRAVSEEIQIGLLQNLLNRVFRTKIRTQYIELYYLFLKNIEIAAPKLHNDQYLEIIFNKLNEKYFFGLLEKPNLKWHNARNRLGSYAFGSDTISISRKLLDGRHQLVEYVMYHEMLHKKLKFSGERHHTSEFRRLERKFDDAAGLEKELGRLVSNQSKRRIFQALFWE
ncbi:DUF45 domain-containing protein [Candidatus Woesearchaeota archaeon]|nr:DUF45 domain-containing protein [Candidatus Woesearchaeota archaeon]